MTKATAKVKARLDAGDARRFGVWGLGFLWTLVIGNWNLKRFVSVCRQPFAQTGQGEREESLDLRTIQ